jgi:GNAT superfamily N-acetyltransferase
VKQRSPTRQPDKEIKVAEATPEQMDLLRREGFREEGFSDAALAPLVNRHHVAIPGIRSQSFGAFASDGVMASGCDLYSDGTIAQIENVETLQAYRRRGLARAACSAATETALEEQHRLIFITAEAGSMPAAFYATLGFDPIGSEYAFTRFPEPSS